MTARAGREGQVETRPLLGRQGKVIEKRGSKLGLLPLQSGEPVVVDGEAAPRSLRGHRRRRRAPPEEGDFTDRRPGPRQRQRRCAQGIEVHCDGALEHEEHVGVVLPLAAKDGACRESLPPAKRR